MRPHSSDRLVSLVSAALDVESDREFNSWNTKACALAISERGEQKLPDEWQQFVIRVCDERGDGVTDWTIKLQMKRKKNPHPEPIIIDDLHPYEQDKSYRCLHINLTECRLSSLHKTQIDEIESFEMKLILNTSSDYLLYVAQRDEPKKSSRSLSKGLSELTVDLMDYLKPVDGKFRLLMPYTTTYVEFRVNRDPILDLKGKTRLCHVK